MSATDKYRDQHEELLDLASKISTRLNVEAICLDPGRIKDMISQLMGKLSYHLAMGDELLYPVLLEHPDEDVSALAKKYVAEMGGIGRDVSDYRRTWLSTKVIRKDPEGFIEQTSILFAVLKKRIEQEDSELYAVPDKLRPGAP